MLAGVGLVKWMLVFTKQAQSDAQKLVPAGLMSKAQRLLDVLEANPFQSPPNYEKLVGDLSGAYSRRINSQHRLVYQLYQDLRIVKIIRMWTHYE
jgi:toxin YoeB